MTDKKAQEIAVRAYEMYKDDELSEEQAEKLFADQLDDVKQMIRAEEIIRNNPDPEVDDEELFK